MAERRAPDVGDGEVRIGEHALDALPTGSYTGNPKHEIHLRLSGAATAA